MYPFLKKWFAEDPGETVHVGFVEVSPGNQGGGFFAEYFRQPPALGEGHPLEPNVGNFYFFAFFHVNVEIVELESGPVPAAPFHDGDFAVVDPFFLVHFAEDALQGFFVDVPAPVLHVPADLFEKGLFPDVGVLIEVDVGFFPGFQVENEVVGIAVFAFLKFPADAGLVEALGQQLAFDFLDLYFQIGFVEFFPLEARQAGQEAGRGVAVAAFENDVVDFNGPPVRDGYAQNGAGPVCRGTRYFNPAVAPFDEVVPDFIDALFELFGVDGGAFSDPQLFFQFFELDVVRRRQFDVPVPGAVVKPGAGLLPEGRREGRQGNVKSDQRFQNLNFLIKSIPNDSRSSFSRSSTDRIS